MRFSVFRALLVCIAAPLALAGSAAAQTVSTTFTGGGAATLNLGASITMEQAITLELTGNAVDPTTTLSNIIAGSSAQINFGAVNTACSASPSTGACHRLSDETGARFVATIDARVVVTGDVTPAFDLGLEAVLVPGVQDTLFRNCGGDGSCPQVASDTFWSNPANGIQVPAPGMGTDSELGAGVASGTVIEHQVALELLDSQAAGPLTLTVQYTATPN